MLVRVDLHVIVRNLRDLHTFAREISCLILANTYGPCVLPSFVWKILARVHLVVNCAESSEFLPIIVQSSCFVELSGPIVRDSCELSAWHTFLQNRRDNGQIPSESTGSGSFVSFSRIG